mmetsp:Transcript_78445/g.230019  ORF Transcript_78445/g.230019 Transcript_78445/m.230019 type:complete len:241 (-) Transcript_78445:7-729(-)
MLCIHEELPHDGPAEQVGVASMQRQWLGRGRGVLRAGGRDLDGPDVLRQPGVHVLVESRAPDHVEQVHLVVQSLLRRGERPQQPVLEEPALQAPELPEELALRVAEQLDVRRLQVVLRPLGHLPESDAQIVPKQELDALQVDTPEAEACVVGVLAVALAALLLQVLADKLHDLADVLGDLAVEGQDLWGILLVLPPHEELRDVLVQESLFLAVCGLLDVRAVIGRVHTTSRRRAPRETRP